MGIFGSDRAVQAPVPGRSRASLVQLLTPHRLLQSRRKGPASTRTANVENNTDIEQFRDVAPEPDNGWGHSPPLTRIVDSFDPGIDGIVFRVTSQQRRLAPDGGAHPRIAQVGYPMPMDQPQALGARLCASTARARFGGLWFALLHSSHHEKTCERFLWTRLCFD
jgi:hypothetical protein